MTPLSSITITAGQLLAVVYALVGVMLIVALYHVILALVDVRKILKKAEQLTTRVESVVVTPLSLVERGFEFISSYMEGMQKQKTQHAHHAHEKKEE